MGCLVWFAAAAAAHEHKPAKVHHTATGQPARRLGRTAELSVITDDLHLKLTLEADFGAFHRSYKELSMGPDGATTTRAGARGCHYKGSATDTKTGEGGRVTARTCGSSSEPPRGPSSRPAPMFIAMSLSFGTAVTLLAIMLVSRLGQVPVSHEILTRLRTLLAYFVVAVASFVAIDHLTRMYAAGHTEVEMFLLVEGGIYPWLFWVGQGLLGTVIPVILLLTPRFAGASQTVVASLLVLLGAFAQLYVLIIGGQAFPMDIFPGYTEKSTYYDGVVAGYAPSLPELALGLGGIGLAILIALVAIRVLPFLPQGSVKQPAG